VIATCFINSPHAYRHTVRASRARIEAVREGTIEQIDGDIATVRTKGRRLIEVPLKRLRAEGQESQIGEFVGAMREASRQ
jgi:hypothetical protein